MSCIIEITVDGVTMQINPNGDISANSESALINNIDVAKLRTLFANLKDKVSMEDATTVTSDSTLIIKGERMYEELRDKNPDKPYLTPLGALYNAKDPDTISALKAYIGSLDSKEVNESGNYLANPSKAYQLSPYSHSEVRAMFFRSGAAARMYDQLMAIPGMETLRISIAIEDNWEGSRLNGVKGAYLTPDNIVQILVPSKYYIHSSNSNKLTVNSFTTMGKTDIRNNIMHELTHAVYSELYNSSPDFKEIMDLIFESFQDAMQVSSKAGDQKEGRKYDGNIHEFIADMFVSKSLRTKMAALTPRGDIATPEKGNLFDAFINSLEAKLGGAPSLLRQAVSIMDTSIQVNNVQDTYDTVLDKANDLEKQSIFFSDGDLDEIIKHTTPRDYYDGYGSTNAKAFWIQREFTDRHDVVDNNWSIRDAYYSKQVYSPTAEQLDRLYEQDLVSIPWLRYIKADKESGVNGRWQEQGVVVNKDKKPVMVAGKMKIVDILRNEDGSIKQTEPDGFSIQPRSKLVPVVFVNSKKKTVVVAKTGLEKPGEYNSVSIPYDVIKGYRKFDRTYFNHNDDFAGKISKLEKAKAELAYTHNDASEREDVKAIIDDKIEALKANEKLAAEIKADIQAHYQAKTFSYKGEDGLFHMNVSQEDYMKSNFKKEDIDFRRFTEPGERPLYIIEQGKGEGKGKWFSRPNPEIFKTLWEERAGSTWVEGDEQIGEAVTKDDMIRVKMNTTYKTEEGEITVKKDQWYPVYQRLSNGILVATAGGKGMIVPFNNIDAYGKNLQTKAFIEIVDRAEKATSIFENNLYTPVEGGKRKLNKEYSSKNIQYKALQFNEEFHVKAEEAVEAAQQRFTDDRKSVISKIIPYKTFVKTKRSFYDTPEGKKKPVIREYTSNDLVIAKSNKGLVVMNTTGKFLRFEWISFDETIPAKGTGKELQFVMHDISAVHDVWNEYKNEKDSYEALKNTKAWENTGTKENPVWKKTIDTTVNPRNFRDVYDFYEDVDGKKIANLERGDVVGMAFEVRNDEGVKEARQFYRKVVDVYDDGTVAVADYYTPNDNDKAKGWNFKAGAYVKLVEANKITKVGYKKYATSNTEENDAVEKQKREPRADLMKRRQYLVDKAAKDLDWNDFIFRNETTAKNWNDKVSNREGSHILYVPFTEATLNYGQKGKDGKPLMQGSDADSVYLNKNGEPLETIEVKDGKGTKRVPKNPAEVQWVQAWFKGNTLVNTIRGLNANTSHFKAEDILVQAGKQRKVAPEILSKVYAGDWAMVTYKGKDGKTKQWAQLIDRIENGDIWVINDDLTTQKINMNKFAGLKLSVRNDRFSGFKRKDQIKEIVKGMNTAKKPTKSRTKSLETDYKSPADSQRAIFEIGNRFEALNPDIVINYATAEEVVQLSNSTGHDYTNARAFVLDGQVGINLDKASISDVIHEYAHLFLHALKYENQGMYQNIISMTKIHPLFDRVAMDYRHLEGDDLNEEVFVTVLGEYLGGGLKTKDNDWQEGKKDIILGFAEYTKRKLAGVMGVTNETIYDIKPEEVLTLSLEDVINLVGDEIMQSRISNIYDAKSVFTRELDKLRRELIDRNQLTEECYG